MQQRIAVAVVLALSFRSGPAFADATITNPFAGVLHTYRVETSPRPLRMHIVQIDPAAPGLSFLVTPQSGPRDTANRTTREFLVETGAQITINAHFFTPWPADGTGTSWLTGLAASSATSGLHGHAYAPFDANLGYPYQNDLPAFAIGADNGSVIVYQAKGDATGYATTPPIVLYNVVSGNEQILAAGVNMAGTGTWDTTLNPRTVIGRTALGEMVLFTVDGRQPGVSEGMTTGEAADFLASQYGVTEAINLDGGGSTTLAMADPSAHVVNVPVGVGNVPGTERSIGSNLAVFASLPLCVADLDCGGIDGACSRGACLRGVCRSVPLADGLPCDDGQPCTAGDTCLAGACVPGPPRDADGDGHVDARCGGDDCNDADASVWSVPGEISNLDVSGSNPAHVVWNTGNTAGGPAAAYDLVSGPLPENPFTSFAGAVCLVTAGGPGFDDERPDPPSGTGCWYLVRARNSCGAGTYGTQERDAAIAACP
jgi:hypothetical protein